MEGLRQALEYIAGLGVEAEKTEVLEINGKTYANKSLHRYDKMPKAEPVKASTLSSMVDYIAQCNGEFPGSMILHIVSPTKVRLVSALDKERERETLFEAVAETSEYEFDRWYDQEKFMIALQANFSHNEDLEAVMKLAGNIERKNDQTFTDDGRTQVATMSVGIASKADVIVPNPVTLVPYRTFQEVEQPASEFVFRVGDSDGPAFKLIEAQGGIWKNEAVANIKGYLLEHLSEMDEEIKNKITVIG